MRAFRDLQTNSSTCMCAHSSVSVYVVRIDRVYVAPQWEVWNRQPPLGKPPQGLTGQEKDQSIHYFYSVNSTVTVLSHHCPYHIGARWTSEHFVTVHETLFTFLQLSSFLIVVRPIKLYVHHVKHILDTKQGCIFVDDRPIYYIYMLTCIICILNAKRHVYVRRRWAQCNPFPLLRSHDWVKQRETSERSS